MCYLFIRYSLLYNYTMYFIRHIIFINDYIMDQLYHLCMLIFENLYHQIVNNINLFHKLYYSCITH